MQRFYFPDLDTGTDSVTIKNMDLINQLLKVLRVEPGYKISFFNGVDAIDMEFEIVSIDKREVYLEKLWDIENDSEIDFDLTLFQALPNHISKIEQVVAKGTEVWITGFYFFKSERSQKLNLSDNKITRLEKIIIESVEQSGRSRVPELIIEDDLNLDEIKDHENIFFHTEDSKSKSLWKIKLNKSKWVNLFVWPEGWFSEDEINIFETNKFSKVHLGKRILRTETTWVVSWFYIIQS